MERTASLNIYGKTVLKAIGEGFVTLNDLMDATGYAAAYVLHGVMNLRSVGIVIVARPGSPGEPTTYTLNGGVENE